LGSNYFAELVYLPKILKITEKIMKLHVINVLKSNTIISPLCPFSNISIGVNYTDVLAKDKLTGELL
jgi:hypothetical protein